MTDSELIEHLRAALDDEAADLRVLSGAALRARSRGRRRRAVRGLFVGLPAVAVATGLVIGAQTGQAPGNPSITADYVTTHAEAALDHADGYIERTTQQFPGGSITTLRDPQTSAMEQTIIVGARVTVCWSAPSNPSATKAPNSGTDTKNLTGAPGTGNTAFDGSWRNTCVDHVARGWWEQAAREPWPVARQAIGSRTLLTPLSDPYQIEVALKSGQVEVLGRGEMAGRDAILLQVTARAGGVTMLWIDAQTYQPIHVNLPDGTPGATPVPDAADTGAGLDVVWLPKTASLLAEVETPQIPADYVQTKPPLPF
jgi:hypothetical protein